MIAEELTSPYSTTTETKESREHVAVESSKTDKILPELNLKQIPPDVQALIKDVLTVKSAQDENEDVDDDYELTAYDLEQEALHKQEKDAVLTAMRHVGLAILASPSYPALSLDMTPEARVTDIKHKFEEASRDKCQTASVTCLALLQKTGLFKDFLLVNSVWKTNKNFNRYMAIHGYFVVQSESGRYYAGSPANYSPKNETGLTDLLEGDVLYEIMEKISEKEGGEWPAPSSVREDMKEGKTYQQPEFVTDAIKGASLKVYAVTNKANGDDDFEMINYPLIPNVVQ